MPKTKEKEVNIPELDELLNNLDVLWDSFKTNSQKKTNASAAKRARKISSNMTSLFKQYRQLTVNITKEKE